MRISLQLSLILALIVAAFSNPLEDEKTLNTTHLESECSGNNCGAHMNHCNRRTKNSDCESVCTKFQYNDGGFCNAGRCICYGAPDDPTRKNSKSTGIFGVIQGR